MASWWQERCSLCIRNTWKLPFNGYRRLRCPKKRSGKTRLWRKARRKSTSFTTPEGASDKRECRTRSRLAGWSPLGWWLGLKRALMQRKSSTGLRETYTAELASNKTTCRQMSVSSGIPMIHGSCCPRKMFSEHSHHRRENHHYRSDTPEWS